MIKQKDEGGHERLLKVINKQKSHHPKNMAPKCHNSIEFVKFTHKKNIFSFFSTFLMEQTRTETRKWCWVSTAGQLILFSLTLIFPNFQAKCNTNLQEKKNKNNFFHFLSQLLLFLLTLKFSQKQICANRILLIDQIILKRNQKSEI